MSNVFSVLYFYFSCFISKQNRFFIALSLLPSKFLAIYAHLPIPFCLYTSAISFRSSLELHGPFLDSLLRKLNQCYLHCLDVRKILNYSWFCKYKSSEIFFHLMLFVETGALTSYLRIIFSC